VCHLNFLYEQVFSFMFTRGFQKQSLKLTISTKKKIGSRTTQGSLFLFLYAHFSQLFVSRLLPLHFFFVSLFLLAFLYVIISFLWFFF